MKILVPKWPSARHVSRSFDKTVSQTSEFLSTGRCNIGNILCLDTTVAHLYV